MISLGKQIKSRLPFSFVKAKKNFCDEKIILDTRNAVYYEMKRKGTTAECRHECREPVT